jgi:hypothetical protein
MFRGGPRDVVDRERRRDRDGRGCHAGEGLDVPMEVGLVDMAALGRDGGGAVPRGGGEVEGGRPPHRAVGLLSAAE